MSRRCRLRFASCAWASNFGVELIRGLGRRRVGVEHHSQLRPLFFESAELRVVELSLFQQHYRTELNFLCSEFCFKFTIFIWAVRYTYVGTNAASLIPLRRTSR
jgi:hypothetical protein